MPRWQNSLMTTEALQMMKRQAVIKEAGRAFGLRGYHNTSLDDVAKALNVAKGTLYNYVKDKQEILWELHKMAWEIAQRALAFGKEEGGTGAQVLRSILTCHIRLLTEELGACGALTELDALRPDNRKVAVKWRDTYQAEMVALIQSGVADGSIRDVDPKLAVFTFMGAINWMPRWYNPQGRMNGSELGEKMCDLLLAGLVRSASPSATAKAPVKSSPVAKAPAKPQAAPRARARAPRA